MSIEINAVQLKIILDWTESIYPEECCGILLGRFLNTTKIVVEVIPTINGWESVNTDSNDEIWRTKHSRYSVPAKETFLAQKRGRDLDLEIIGFFHSHPDYPAVPSECDRAQAWEIYSYPIVSVIQGKAIDIQSWVLDCHKIFQSEQIQLLND